MKQDLILPWRDSGCLFRRRHFEFIRNYYSKEFNVIIADNEGKFDVATARNNGVRQSTSDVVVIFDADTYVDYESIYAAIFATQLYGGLIKPFTIFGYMDEESTERFYEGERNFSSLKFQNDPSRDFQGGAWIINKEQYWLIGGMDENFPGWGAEDDAFHLICRKTFGPEIWVGGFGYHLYHPAHRVTSKENYKRLVSKYINQ